MALDGITGKRPAKLPRRMIKFVFHWVKCPSGRLTMKFAKSEKITGLLKAWVGGNAAAQAELMPLVYNELRYLARYYRRNAGAGNTIQTTALVHEAYLRLVDIDNVDWQDRVHFFAVSAQLMRRILVDTA